MWSTRLLITYNQRRRKKKSQTMSSSPIICTSGLVTFLFLFSCSLRWILYKHLMYLITSDILVGSRCDLVLFFLWNSVSNEGNKKKILNYGFVSCLFCNISLEPDAQDRLFHILKGFISHIHLGKRQWKMFGEVWPRHKNKNLKGSAFCWAWWCLTRVTAKLASSS